MNFKVHLHAKFRAFLITFAVVDQSFEIGIDAKGMLIANSVLEFPPANALVPVNTRGIILSIWR